MTSKERVMLTFEHKKTDRIPVWCGASPAFIEKAKAELGLGSSEALFQRFGDDFRRVHGTYIGPDERSYDKMLSDEASSRTPFGVERHGYEYGMALSHPLEGCTMQELIDYPWPKPKWISASTINDQISIYKHEYAILGGDWSPFFHDAIDLFGMENLLIKMYEDPLLVDALFVHIVDYYYGVNEIIFNEASDNIDIFFLGNDLGSQNGPLIGGALFKRFILNHIKRLADQAHSYGLKVMMHSCGSIESLIVDLSEAGIDALQALQPDALNMSPEHLKSTYGDKMVFNGCVDSHNTLIDGTPDTTIVATKHVIDVMKPGGGFILSPSHDYLLEETPVANVVAMYDTALEYGWY